MSGVPVYLKGRGRGRGRGNVEQNKAKWTNGSGSENNVKDNGWKNGVTSKQSKQEISRNSINDKLSVDEAQKKFEAVSSQHQQAIQNVLEESQFSDEEEGDIGDNVLSTVFKSYSDTIDHGEDEEKAREDMMYSFRSGTAACLVCIENIKREEAIWSCKVCYAMFHIPCIQKWVKEGVYQQVYKSDENIDAKSVPWHCPKCRTEFSQIECPTRYSCFCEKVIEPKFDPWLVPHSCGQTCGKNLKPECGHTCLLLCHPGPCPPCPKTVRVTCYCQKQSPQIKRCSARTWSCGQPCGYQLTCGQHRCQDPCHAGGCPPCTKTSKQKCMCSKSMAVRECATPRWQCDEPCGKRLACGNHVCEKVCHGGNCGPCPRSGLRKCPCGKTEDSLPCTEDIPTCGDTCGKMLDCGIHTCPERCHTGSCGKCLNVATKTCLCGQRKKELPCYKDYHCETKCTRMRDCGKHQCRRKCCDGNCSPCEQTCNKPLGCKTHKCASRCHPGRCYPCSNTVEITCNCKMARITVPCGREKITKPPRCHQKCRRPPLCHHPATIPHSCHFGECPPCRLPCLKQLSLCGHSCPLMCHSAVKVKIKENLNVAGPWEGRPTIREEIQDKPCPPCRVPIPIQCLGLHETGNFACSDVRPYSCGRPCDRLLACGNHTCQLLCHQVTGAKENGKAGDNCSPCDEGCDKPRPEGCTHKCPLLKCHPGDCSPCTQMIRMRCHCQIMVQHLDCNKLTNSDEHTKNTLRSCGGQCPKKLSCGHVCSSNCHAGPCPMEKKCIKKTTRKCACKRIKKEVVCKDVTSKVLDCDEKCKEEQEKKKEEEEEKKRLLNEEEIKQQQAKVEEFEKRMGKGRKRRKKYDEEEEEKLTFIQQHKKLLIMSLTVAVLAIFAYSLLLQ
ncbi:NF-X1-type zinc finger protein NFXL1-like isoform X1 [Mytilus californianus]|uniref:NF-X1-type zinc finger protein NFXL1-like isoform X1 n=2 Tax=Mytilus californianus TaxID=6549 RepID=UPI0022476CD9|nr:NF-X1-type zinc finger protein NFXL1-like isoform X1 [Mytilus californianus]